MKKSKLSSKLFCLIFTWIIIAAVAPSAYAISISLSDNGTPNSFAKLVEKVSPAVVNIYSTKDVRAAQPNAFQGVDPFFDQFLKDFYGRNYPQQQPPRREQNSLGSGFIISEDGEVLTNFHVIAGADEVFVNLHSGEKLKADILGYDEKLDIALLKIHGTQSFPVVNLGDSDGAAIGDWVLAVGNPFGLGQTVTAGIISAKGRVLGAGPYDDFIQTDASINPGNSGGPLFNMNGDVVGINTAIIASGQGIGFAIPINMVKQAKAQLAKSGHVSRGWLGVSIKDLPQGGGAQLPKSGVLLIEVVPGGPAERANLAVGDIVTQVGGKEIVNAQTLPRVVASYQPGATVAITYWRNGKQAETQTVLGDLDNPHKAFIYPTGQNSNTDETANGQIGIDVRDIEIADNITVKGAIITKVRPDSIAASVGLLRGDIVLAINNQVVDSVKAFKTLIDKLGAQDAISLHVMRGNAVMYFAFRK